jgi:DNA-binding transcriptional regulator YiaG
MLAEEHCAKQSCDEQLHEHQAGRQHGLQAGVEMTAKKWSDIRAQRFSPEELRQIDEEIESELLEMDLRALREAVGLTQGELAQRVEITQSQLSKMERREDHRLSTLRRYVEALGGNLEICAVINGRRIKLAEG